ncbi:hypothetical protein ACE1OC_00665 [Streptomyces sp. DSM 116496]|uniref:hypothetical protein n=1 Tax=Streptomyces stoeckheimensis TaxID=3344656 RepID=UPI0038B38663
MRGDLALGDARGRALLGRDRDVEARADPRQGRSGMWRVYGSFSHGLGYGSVHVPEEVQLIWV